MTLLTKENYNATMKNQNEDINKVKTQPQPQNSKKDFCLSDKIDNAFNHIQFERQYKNKQIVCKDEDNQFLRIEDVKEFIKRLKEDEVYYFRCCHKCGRVWQSFHCPHDGCQGTCPDCNTRALSFKNKECNCEFLMEVNKIDKLAGEKLCK